MHLLLLLLTFLGNISYLLTLAHSNDRSSNLSISIHVLFSIYFVTDTGISESLHDKFSVSNCSNSGRTKTIHSIQGLLWLFFSLRHFSARQNSINLPIFNRDKIQAILPILIKKTCLPSVFIIYFDKKTH